MADSAPPAQVVAGPLSKKLRRRAVWAIVSAPLRQCWPRPWTQRWLVLAGTATLALAVGMLAATGSWHPAIAVVIAVVTVFTFGALGLLVWLWLLAGTRRARGWRILDRHGNPPAIAAARLVDRNGHRTLTDLVAVPAGAGAGAELVRAVQAEAIPIVLTPANQKLCAFYESLGFVRTSQPRRGRRSPYRWEPPTPNPG